MAAKVEVTASKTVKETVAQNLSINRYVMGLEPSYNINLTYCDNEYLADEAGTKTRLISSGQNQKNVYFNQEKVAGFYSTPLKKADGTVTTLGELLAELMDEAIKYDLENPAPVNPMMLPPVV